MDKIREMIATAPSKIAAINMLNTMLVFSKITEEQYEKGRELIRKEFDK